MSSSVIESADTSMFWHEIPFRFKFPPSVFLMQFERPDSISWRVAIMFYPERSVGNRNSTQDDSFVSSPVSSSINLFSLNTANPLG